jgi:membrane-bound serine protease (ClpP class)
VGAAVVLSSYVLQIQQVNWAGTALILLAFVFLAVDLTVTNHGLPTVGAVVALVLGLLTLFDATATYFLASLVALVSLSLLLGTFLTGSWSEARAARGRPSITGVEGMIGEVGVVREPVGASSPGWVSVHGELWQATVAIAPEDAYEQMREQSIRVGRRVQVVGFRDRKVVVLPFERAEFEHQSSSY